MMDRLVSVLYADVFIIQRGPLFDQEAVRIIITTGDIAQVTCCEQAPVNDTGCSYQPLGSVAAERIGVAVDIQCDAIYSDLLTDIARDDVGVVAGFSQVVILHFGTAICEI